MTARGALDLSEGLELVTVRRLVRQTPVAWLALGPGDKPLVSAGQSVLAGAPLAERVRIPLVVDVPAGALDADARSGTWWEDDGKRHGLRRTRATVEDGDLLYRSNGDWRVATGERTEQLEAPVAGIVREVGRGMGIALTIAGSGLPGVVGHGGPSRGRLEIVAGADGDVRAGSLDVARAGAIIVAGSRVDAETITRARAMGVRGIVVAGLAGHDLRGVAASEARQRASLQPLAPFAILVLEGHARRPIAGPMMALLSALEGTEVGLVCDPPMLVFDPPGTPLPAPAADWVRVRHGPAAGREGRWIGLAGRRRFAAGVELEAGLIDVEEDHPLAVPLADLERFG